MTPRLRRLLLAWALLMVLLAIELGASFLPLARPARPLVLLPAFLMVALVGTFFMQIGRGVTIVRLFAAAGLLWLCILLGLGSLDPLTRIDYHQPEMTRGGRSSPGRFVVTRRHHHSRLPETDSGSPRHNFLPDAGSWTGMPDGGAHRENLAARRQSRPTDGK